MFSAKLVHPTSLSVQTKELSMIDVPSIVYGTALFVCNFNESHGHAELFLTHFHADHMRGLCHDWMRSRLHTSSTTNMLLQKKFGLTTLICPRLDEPFEAWMQKNRLKVVWTFIDANVCPGSAMIIFEKLGNGQGPVIHTRDFRYYNERRQNPTLQRVASFAS